MSGGSWRNISWGELIVGALLALAGSIVYFHYTAESPELVYEEFPPARFTSQAAEVSIYNVAVDNVGNQEASSVIVHLTLPPDTIIQELQVKPSSTAIDYGIAEQGSNTRQVRFPLLNAGEGARFSLLVSKGNDAKLTVEVRANGAVGHPRVKDEGSMLPSLLLGVSSSILAAVLAAFVALFNKRTTRLQNLFESSVAQQMRALRTQASKTTESTGTQKSIAQLITEQSWRLFYNPTVAGKSKVMRFAPNGLILEGRNQNEATWRVQNDLLELMNDRGGVHGRFYYSPPDKRFYHTNDPDTGAIVKHGIRDQYIAPEVATR